MAEEEPLNEKLTREEILKIYATEGATVAARSASVSTRTIQRWAAQEGIETGWEPQPTLGHNTVACYLRGCRRPGCVEANRQNNREVKERRIKRFRAGKVQIKHGVSGYSNWSCRCGECTSAWSAYLRDRRNRAKSRPVESSGADDPQG